MIQLVRILGLLSGGGLLVSTAWATPVVDALPTGGQVDQGSASISQSGAQMNINQTSQRAVINWQSFDVGADAKVHIIQPNQAAALLNRVVTNKPSEIFGKIEANGQVVLVNTNGIVFGQDGSASASSFTASTLDISDDDFMAGNNRYSSNGSQGAISNHGTIQAKEGGYVALLGAQVTNDGKIIAQNGSVALGAAQTIAVPMTSSGKIKMELNAGHLNAAIENTSNGVIVSEGGQVYIQAAALNDAVASINQAGQIDTSGQQAGDVTILADQGAIKIDGSITANSTESTNKGGNIIIGRDPATAQLAKSTDVSGARLEAKQGFIETSGDYLKTDQVKVSAGEWLIDPNDITISNAVDSGGMTNTSGTIADGTTPSNINISTLLTAMNSGNVTINTSTGTGGSGDITLVDPIAFDGAIYSNLATTGSTLTLNAGRDIAVNGAISSSNAAYVTLTLNAARHITTNADISTKGWVTMTAGTGGNLIINNLIQSTEAGLNLAAANAVWSSAQGQILFGANGKLDYVAGLGLNSGLSTTDNFSRSNFDDSIHILNASVIQNSRFSNFSVLGFDTVSISKAISANTINVAAKNILVNNAALTSDAWIQLWAGAFDNSNGTYNADGWQQQSGQLAITGSSMLSYAAGSTIDLRSGINDLTTGKRSILDDANITWASSGNGSVLLYGFDKITTTKDIVGGVFNWQAKDIAVGANITSSANMFLRAAAFNQAATAAIKGAYLASNESYKNNLGQITFAPTTQVSYGLNLDLRSGLAYDANNLSTGARSNLLGSNINWTNNNPNNYVYLGGFDTVTLDSPATASNFTVIAQNINVNANNIKANGNMLLNAASFDPGTAIKGSYTATGWYNLDGQVKVEPSVTSLSATSFDFRSGVDASNRSGTGTYNMGARIDLADVLKPYQASGAPSPSGVTGLYLAGFQDVILPTNITEIAGAGGYTVISRNIDGSGLAGKTLDAYSLKLWSASFTNIGGVNKYNSATKGGMGLGGDTNNYGTLTLPSSLAIQSSGIDFVSGLSTVDGKSRTDLSPVSISPYVDPSNPTKYTGVYSTDGKSTGVRLGGMRYLNLHGFNNLTLPTNSALTDINKNALNYEVVDITANNIAINSDINAGQGSWWPSPYYMYIKAGSYSATTGINNGGVNLGAMTFKPGIVLRDSALNLNGLYGWASGYYGFDSGMTLINGATPADFTGVKLGYTKYDYTAGATGAYVPSNPALAAYANLNISGFDNTDIQMEVPNDVLRIRTGGWGNTLNITQRVASTGTISIHHDLDASNSGSITLDAGNGSIRMGQHVAKTSSMTVNAGANSAVNIDADTLNMTSRIAGKTLVVNEANNLSVSSLGGAGNTEINVRGEISLVNNVSLTGTAGLTLRADAQYGQTINDTDTSNSLIVEDLNRVFSTNQLTSADTTVGSVGGDGLGSIVVNTAQPTILAPVFRQVVVADSASFTVPAANTYYMADGTAYASGAVIPKGTIFTIASGVTIPTTLDNVTASGIPIRAIATVTQGGWTVPAGVTNTLYDVNGVAYAPGTALSVGTLVYYKPSYTLPAGNISATGSTNGQQQLYVISGYSTSGGTSVANYTSLGLSTAASYTPVAGSTLAASATKLSIDTPVDASITANYYGNPVSGSANTLHLSGQFYTINGTQVAPTLLNNLYVGKSTSGNGWDTAWGTAMLSTSGGDLRLFSGPKHAIAGPGYQIGDAADLSIFSNPTTNDFTNSKSVMSGAIKLMSGAGNLVALGFRDVLLDASGVLTSSGNVTIGASRDFKLNTDVVLGGNNKLATLMAGGMLTNKNSNGTYNSINNTIGQTRNVLLLAGGGVDLQTDVTAIAGSLQDNPVMTATLAGGITATGIFSVKGKNGLMVGGDFTNNQVNNVTFDGTAGILYAASTPLTRSGITSTAIATGTGGVATNYGGVKLTATTGDLTVNKAIDTTANGGEINLKAAVNVNLAADVKTTQAAFIEASTGTILQTAGRIYAGNAVLTTPLALGTAGNRIKTTVTQLGLSATGDIFIDEADSVTVSAKTTTGKVDVLSDAGSIIVGSLNLSPQVATNAVGYNQVGITAPSTVLLTALNANSASDEAIKVNANITAGSDVSLIGISTGIGGVAVNANVASGGAINVTGNATNSAIEVNSNGTLTAAGDLTLTGTATAVDGVVINGNLVSSGTINVLGSAIDGDAAVRLGSGAQIGNNSTAGHKTTIQALNGDIVADGIGSAAAITQAATAGAIELTAGIGGVAKTGAIDGTNLLITQNNTQGVLVITDGTGDVTAPKVINNGSGNVVIGAGSAFAANTGLNKTTDNGGQVLTVTGNTITQNSTGNTRIYTGSAAAAGLLSNLDSAFTNLYFNTTSNPLNTKLNTIYGTSLVGSNVNTVSQVMFRENITPTFVLTLPTVNVTKVYGAVDPSIGALRQAAQTAYTNAGKPSILNSVYGVNSFGMAASEVLSSFTLDGRVAGENVIAGASPYYDYTWAIPTTLNTRFDSAGATPTLQITPAPLTVTVNDASGFVTVNPNQYSAAGDTFTYTGFLTGTTVNGVVINDSASSYFTNGALQFTDRTYTGTTNPLPIVGTYPSQYDVTASALATTNNNYTLTVAKGTATVVAADNLLIKVGDATKTYGDLLATNAGKTAQTISVASYCLTGSANCSGNNEARLSVTSLGLGAWRVTDTTNTSYDFNVTVDTNGAVNATGGYLNAGWYNFGTDLVATATSNFKGTTTIGKLTVDKANLTLSGSRVYDATTRFAGQYLTATGANGESFTVTGAGLAGNLTSKDVAANQNQVMNSVDGLALGTSSNGGISSNYNLLSHVNSSVTLTKAALTATGNSRSVTYNGVDQTVTGFTVSGLLGTDAVTDLTSISATGAIGKNAGSYVNAVTAGVETNYNVTTANGDLQIAKANASVKPNTVTSTYNGTIQTVTDFTASGLVNGETEAVLTGVSVSGSGKNVGTYTTIASGTDSNYNLSFVNGSLQIAKAPLMFSVGQVSKVYDGTNALEPINLIANGVFYTDNISAVANIASFDNNRSNAGNGLAYTLSHIALSGSDANNYMITNSLVTGFGAITPKSLLIAAKAQDKMYDGNVTAQVTVDRLIGLVGNQTLGIKALGEFNSADAGNNILVKTTYQFSDGQNSGLIANYLLPTTEFLTASIFPLPNKHNAISELNPVTVNPTFYTTDRKIPIQEKVFGIQLDKSMKSQCTDEFSSECKNKTAKLRKGEKFDTFY